MRIFVTQNRMSSALFGYTYESIIACQNFTVNTVGEFFWEARVLRQKWWKNLKMKYIDVKFYWKSRSSFSAFY